jgi:hypothetical protein
MVSRRTMYDWIQKDEDLQQAVKDGRELMIDLAENKLKDKITDGDNTSIIFYLKTQAKHRGYIERQEIAHDLPEANISVNVSGDIPEFTEPEGDE